MPDIHVAQLSLMVNITGTVCLNQQIICISKHIIRRPIF